MLFRSRYQLFVNKNNIMRILLLFTIILITFSCKGNDVENNIGRNVVFPDSLLARFKGKYVDDNFNESLLKLVVFYNSQGCSSCRMKELSEWNYKLKELSDLGYYPDVVDVIFIFEVGNYIRKKDVDLKFYNINQIVYYDIEKDFDKYNKLSNNYIYQIGRAHV